MAILLLLWPFRSGASTGRVTTRRVPRCSQHYLCFFSVVMLVECRESQANDGERKGPARGGAGERETWTVRRRRQAVAIVCHRAKHVSGPKSYLVRLASQKGVWKQSQLSNGFLRALSKEGLRSYLPLRSVEGGRVLIAYFKERGIPGKSLPGPVQKAWATPRDHFHE